MTDHVPGSWATKFPVKSLVGFDRAEFQMDISPTDAATLALVINGQGPIYNYGAPIVKAPKKYDTFYQRIPIELLQEGENNLELAFDAMHGQLSRRTIFLRRLKLRLIKKSEI